MGYGPLASTLGYIHARKRMNTCTLVHTHTINKHCKPEHECSDTELADYFLEVNSEENEWGLRKFVFFKGF